MAQVTVNWLAAMVYVGAVLLSHATTLCAGHHQHTHQTTRQQVLAMTNSATRQQQHQTQHQHQWQYAGARSGLGLEVGSVATSKSVSTMFATLFEQKRALQKMETRRSESRGRHSGSSLGKSCKFELQGVPVDPVTKELCAFPSDSGSGVNDKSSRHPSLRLGPRAKGWVSCGLFSDVTEKTGWSELHIWTSPKTEYPDPMFAAGMVEGHLSHARILQFFHNTQSSRSPRLTNDLEKFIHAQRDFLNNKVAQISSTAAEPQNRGSGEDDARYWRAIGGLLSQIRGLHEGYNIAARAGGGEALTLDQFWLMNMDGDLIELQGAVDKGLVTIPGVPLRGRESSLLGEDRFQEVSTSKQWKDALLRTVHKGLVHKRKQKARIANISGTAQEAVAETEMAARTDDTATDDANARNDEWRSLVRRVGHCTALVSLAPGNGDLLVGHNSWEDYNEMLRTFKHYEYAHPGHTGASNSGTSADPFRVSMSSYPGLLASTDDYYELGNGLVLQKIKTKAVPSWIASLAANQLATSGEEWAKVFRRHNAGTYNCQWMIVDYTKFKKGSPLLPGTLWVLETIPGASQMQDMTSQLQSNGYWLSANRPFFQPIRDATGYQFRDDDLVSFDNNPRAKIAHEHVHNQKEVRSLEQLMWFMRYNKFTEDAASHGDPSYTVAARADLDRVHPTLNGAVDAKCVDAASVANMRTMAISGATAQGLAPFSFGAWEGSREEVRHEGMPDPFKFDWYCMTGFGVNGVGGEVAKIQSRAQRTGGTKAKKHAKVTTKPTSFGTARTGVAKEDSQLTVSSSPPSSPSVVVIASPVTLSSSKEPSTVLGGPTNGRSAGLDVLLETGESETDGFSRQVTSIAKVVQHCE